MKATARSLRPLEGRHAVLTAAGSGLGLAAALRFAADGAKVVVSDLDEDRASAVAEAIRAQGGQAWALRCDASVGDGGGWIAWTR